jgi:predicted DCC family thiol-disulfide oxidoreductase YuxK
VDRPEKPLAIFDGECSFCREWIARWRSITGDRVDYAPYQEVASRFPEIPVESFQRALHLIEPDGTVTRAAESTFRILAQSPGHGGPLALYRAFRPFAWISEWCYRRIANHRTVLFHLTRWIWGDHLVPPGERITAWIFLRLLGLIFGIAFLSLWIQVIGLMGERGILPAGTLLSLAHERLGLVRYAYFPTLCWFGAGDGALHFLCALGVFFSALLALGIVPVLALAGAWATYLSLTVVGQDFLWFQWDTLLLEAGLLALFLSPWVWRSRSETDPPPSRAGIFLIRWLLFRLMFSSAVVKISSGDPSWRSLTALRFHYETQCLPPWTAWYAHHLSASSQRISTVMMFVIEGLVPFLIIAPRRIRFGAGLAIAFLQVLILLTGNYGFFNWVTIALCVMLLDDAVWPAWVRRLHRPARPDARRGAWPTWIVRPAAITLFLLSLVPLVSAFRVSTNWLGPLNWGYRLASSFRSINPYGLFAVMTTQRNEIVVEGSDDGVDWRAYEFKYKPGDVNRRPAFVAPHQPRLDWQMWFASLSDYRREPWFLYFCQRLLEGSPPVLALLDENPFPRAPPRFIRASFYEYHFTDAATRKKTGAWWRRRYLGLYCPILTVRDGQLLSVPPEAFAR